MIRIYLGVLLALILTACSSGGSKDQEDSAVSPRGIAALALLNSRFPVRDLIDVLAASPSPAVGVLHAAFGYEYGNLQLIAQRFPGLLIVLYADCGPCRPPRRDRLVFDIISPSLDIDQLNEALESGNSQVLEQHRAEYFNIRTQIALLGADVKIIIHPQLEDNLSDSAYIALHDLLSYVMADLKNVTIARNPLGPGVSLGPVEIHSYNSNAALALRPGDIISGDGELFCLPGDGCTGYSYDDIKNWLMAARGASVISLIWRPDMQGLPFQTAPYLVPPNQRQYVISHKQTLIDLMQLQ